MKYYICKRWYYLFTEQLKWEVHTHEDDKREVQINKEAICSVDPVFRHKPPQSIRWLATDKGY